MADSYRQALNNLANKERLQLEYEYAPSGPKNAEVWTAVCKIGGVEHGSGTSVNKGDAKEIASKAAYNLWVQRKSSK